jgi:hypothetical protein
MVYIYIFSKLSVVSLKMWSSETKMKRQKSFCNKIEKTNIFCFVFLSSKENIGDSFRMLHLAIKVSILK